MCKGKRTEKDFWKKYHGFEPYVESYVCVHANVNHYYSDYYDAIAYKGSKIS